MRPYSVRVILLQIRPLDTSSTRKRFVPYGLWTALCFYPGILAVPFHTLFTRDMPRSSLSFHFLRCFISTQMSSSRSEMLLSTIACQPPVWSVLNGSLFLAIAPQSLSSLWVCPAQMTAVFHGAYESTLPNCCTSSHKFCFMALPQSLKKSS